MCGLACFSGLGWMAILHLGNTYGFIRHGDSRSNTLCLAREVAVWFMFLDAMITYDRSIGTREAFMQEAASFVSFFGPAGRIRGSDPRGAGTTRTLRQAAICLKKANPQATPADSTRGSAKNTRRVMVA